MSWRTVIIQGRCKLDYRMGYMVVRSAETRRIYLEEIAVLVLESTAISLTGALMEALIQHKVRVIFCDSKRNPMAELTPHHGCYDSSDKIKVQMAWTDKVKGEVWQSIIREKILKQAAFLNELGKTREYHMLMGYAEEVQPLDATNREGHAAKVYFNALFGLAFSREQDNPINAALNYGYAVMLSAVNREICALGYLTQLGVFHDNRFNHFNLGCDLMEPFRILIDRAVMELLPEVFEKQQKVRLWQCLNEPVRIGGSKQTALNALRIYVRSVTEALCDGKVELIQYYTEI